MKHFLILLLLCPLISVCQNNSAPARPEESPAPGRVRVVQNGLWDTDSNTYDKNGPGRTVVTADGELLRGATLWCFCFHPKKVKYAQQFSAWQTIKDHHFNAVRLALNYKEPDKLEDNPEGEPFRWTLDEFLLEIDQWVDWAEALGLYVILDHHEVGTHTQEWLLEFWTAAAPRYADRTHVIYEIANEPVAWRPKDYTDQDIADFLEIYQLMRQHAPETHVIFLSYAVPANGMDKVADKLTGVDWSNASVGFHGYWTTSSTHIRSLKVNYPAINTEFMSYTPNHGASSYKMDGYLWQNQLMEKLRISWFIWDAAYREDYIPKVLQPMIQHAEENGYAWWKESSIHAETGSVHDFELHQNFPNPFNPSTRIVFDLAQTAEINVAVFDIHGRKIRTLIDAVRSGGSHQVLWHGMDENGFPVASGVYFYKIRSNVFQAAKRMLLIR